MANVHSKALSECTATWSVFIHCCQVKHSHVSISHRYSAIHTLQLSQAATFPITYMLVISVNYCNSKIPRILNICKCNVYMPSFREAISG